MKIRSITSFFNPSLENPGATLAHLARFTKDAVSAFTSETIEVQTTRLATVPFATYTDLSDRSSTMKVIKSLESSARDAGYNYLSIGPAIPEYPESYALIPEIFPKLKSSLLQALLLTERKACT